MNDHQELLSENSIFLGEVRNLGGGGAALTGGVLGFSTGDTIGAGAY